MAKRLLIYLCLGCVLAAGSMGCRLAAGVTAASIAVVAGTVHLAGRTVQATGRTVGEALHFGKSRVDKRTEQAARIVFRNGDFVAARSESVKTLWIASRMTFTQMRFRNIRGKYDLLSGEMTATTIDNKKIDLRLKAVGSRETEMRIRIGARGDQSTSELIYNSIVARIPAPPPQPAAAP